METGRGREHTFITNAQSARQRVNRALGNGSFGGSNLHEQFQIFFREMIDAGVSEKEARRVAKKAYKYFDSIEAF